ncbi:MAG: CotH kinase family protein [Planctomycetota bacterium]|nr:CotH kinase family protein [Planctomycetota bacterium]
MTNRNTTLGQTARGAFGFAWRWSLIATVPIGAAFALWCVRTIDHYIDYGRSFDSLNGFVTLERIGALEARIVLRDAELAARPRRRASADSIRGLNLFLPEAAENALLVDLPHSGRRYVEAGLVYPDGALREVRVKMRGDHFWHWAGRKQSLRIKTKKKNLFERIRGINLNAPKMPDQVSGHLSYYLARQMGLIAPRSEMVELTINGSYRGVYESFEQMEEMTIRTHGRMPGDLYSGDIVQRNAFRGIGRRVFENEGLWEKLAINNHFEADEDAALSRLINLLDASPSVARADALNELLDMDAFGRYAAFRSLCQTFHYDETHNWRLYYDPWRNRFEPAVWDPVGWHIGWLPKEGQPAAADIITARIDEVLLEDSAFVVARQRALDSFFEDGLNERLLQYLDDLLARIRPSIERDPGLCYVVEMLTTGQVFAAQEKLRADVIGIARDLADTYRAPSVLEYAVAAGAPGSLRLRVEGRRPFENVELALATPPDGRLEARLVWADLNGGVQRIDVSGAVIQQGSRVKIDVPLVSQFIRVVEEERPIRLQNAIYVQPATYDLILGGEGFAGNSVIGLAGYHAGDVRVGASRRDRIEPIAFAQATAVARAVPLRVPQAWSGELEFEGIQTIEDDVVIAPGTVLKMAPGASLIFEGRLTAIGTNEAPIRVKPAREGQTPWGSFAIRGHGADGSELAWCEMSLGSGYKVPLAEYSAMFSVHEVDDAVVRSCLFRDSQNLNGEMPDRSLEGSDAGVHVDDMVHVVYGTIRFADCTFARSLFDAVDLDISEALLERCRFLDSGNDALDLMTSNVVMRDCWIEGSIDKGVSVGEDTRAFALNCTIKDCEIGMQIKDRSQAVVYNCEVTGNRQGIDAYKKNWRYDSGGFGYVYNSVIADNGSMLTADKHSRLLVDDSLVSPRVESTKRVRLDATCDVGPSRAAKHRSLRRFPEEEQAALEFFRPFWAEVDPRTRGVHAQK